MKENREKIKAFLARVVGDYDLQDNEDIFGLGFVNSMFAMQLVLFVEQEFKISIENEDLEIDNFNTVNALVNLVERKTAVLTSN
ncbi:acyl carrier protein [Microcoleus sp. BROC3]|uniref:acyl carrier protein n=1 Tax=Microcoleus sp. BROC3 TaxID=3055323 RepID=UPI002FD412E2